METVDQGKFSCQQCGKSYRWKPDFAGRKVKCKCGFTMTAPKEPPGAPADEPDRDRRYSVADEGKQAAKAGAVETALRCPSCKEALEPGAMVCDSCGFNLKTGSKPAAKKAAAVGGSPAAVMGAPGGGGTASALAAYGAPRRGLQKDAPQDFKAIDMYLPIGLIVGGVALTVLQYMQFNPTNEPFLQALMYTGLKLVISFVLVVIGCVFLIKWMEMALGDPALAALKLAGIVIGPTAIANIISFLIHDAPPTGWGLVGFFIAFGLFFILYHYLFEFDMSEKWLIVGMTTMVCMLATPFLFQLIIHGNPGALGSKGAQNDDAVIQYMLDLGRPKPAKAWIDDSRGRIVGSWPRPDSEELINGLNDLVGSEVYVGPVGPQAAEIYVKLPSNAKKRKAVIDFVTSWNAKHGRKPATDNGAKWMLIPFMPYDHPEPVGF